MHAREKLRRIMKKAKKKSAATRTKKPIPPISIPRKQTAGFAYQYAIKKMYGVPERLVCFDEKKSAKDKVIKRLMQA